MCKECYIDDQRITPLHKPLDCLTNHTQYICGTCGRCICIEHDARRGLQRWNFPFQSLEIAKMYLRTAYYTMKRSCGIYELRNDKGRIFYKIFVSENDLRIFLQKNKDKICVHRKPIFIIDHYQEYPDTQVRRLTQEEIKKYIAEQSVLK